MLSANTPELMGSRSFMWVTTSLAMLSKPRRNRLGGECSILESLLN